MNFIKKPYLQRPDTGGMTVMWETDEPGDALLRVWDCYAPAIPDTYVCEYRPCGMMVEFHGTFGVNHRVEASGLKSGTDYCYQAVTVGETGRVESEILVFRTAPACGTAFRVGFVAEMGGANQPQNSPDIIRELSFSRPDLVMFMGDAVWDGDVEEDWNKYFFTPFENLFTTTPFYHVMGNHDAEGRQLASRYFAAPPVNSFVYSDARFIVLDTTLFAKRTGKGDGSSEMKAFDTFNENDSQWKFLEKELAQRDTAWTFVCMHYPPYASALFEAPCMRRLNPLFDKYGVDAVFASHTLHYERSHPLAGGKPAPEGTVYFIVGGIGDYPQWVRHKTLPVTARIMPKPHFLVMDITPFGVNVSAYDRNGAMFDCWSKKKP